MSMTMAEKNTGESSGTKGNRGRNYCYGQHRRGHDP